MATTPMSIRLTEGEKKMLKRWQKHLAPTQGALSDSRAIAQAIRSALTKITGKEGGR